MLLGLFGVFLFTPLFFPFFFPEVVVLLLFPLPSKTDGVGVRLFWFCPWDFIIIFPATPLFPFLFPFLFPELVVPFREVAVFLLFTGFELGLSDATPVIWDPARPAFWRLGFSMILFKPITLAVPWADVRNQSLGVTPLTVHIYKNILAIMVSPVVKA